MGIVLVFIPLIAKIIREALESEGYRVITVANGREALRSIEAEQPDVVVLDLLSAQSNGREVLKRLKANHETCDLPVIVYTWLLEDCIQFRLGEHDAWLLAPAGPTFLEDLLAKLKEAMRAPRQERASSPRRPTQLEEIWEQATQRSWSFHLDPTPFIGGREWLPGHAMEAARPIAWLKKGDMRDHGPDENDLVVVLLVDEEDWERHGPSLRGLGPLGPGQILSEVLGRPQEVLVVRG